MKVGFVPFVLSMSLSVSLFFRPCQRRRTKVKRWAARYAAHNTVGTSALLRCSTVIAMLVATMIPAARGSEKVKGIHAYCNLVGTADEPDQNYMSADDEKQIRERLQLKDSCLSGCYPHPLNVGCAHSPE
jgi:hypothetical protein